MARFVQAWAKLLEAWGTPAERITPPARCAHASTQDEGLGRGRQALDMACRQHVGALLAAASQVRSGKQLVGVAACQGSARMLG